jgi:GTP-binding protein Era
MAERSEPAAAGDTRCAFIALVGAPNAGKSTLLNALVGQKLSIVSPKVQTTRSRVLGIAIEERAQLVYIDTPGIFRDPKRRLERAMVKAAWSGAGDADLVLVLVDAARGFDRDSRTIVETLKDKQLMLALNKIDLVKRPVLLELAAKINAAVPLLATFMISAQSGDGIADLKRDLARRAPPGPWAYPEDQLAEMPLRLMAAEFTREQLFLQLHEELPYSLMVETETWKDQPDGSARIDQAITVARDSHKAIVLGKGGQRLKAVGSAARAELAAALGRPVHLFLHVKVRENWLEDPARYREIGLEFDS